MRVGILWVVVLVLGMQTMSWGESRPQVIAHRGASGYLPEHTLPAVAMAHAQRADYIEQDVVLTKDGVPVVLHDIHLDQVTDVAAAFPKRSRDDGRYYAIDFTLAEVKALQVSERFDLKTGQAVYPKRFPVGRGEFRVPTLKEEVELIQGLNQSSGREVGICVEIKSPAWHAEQGQDICRMTLAVLAELGYTKHDQKVLVECFDAAATRRMREVLKCELPLVQLIGENGWNEAPTDFDRLRTPEGLKETAEYADAIGPWLPHVLAMNGDALEPTPLIGQAHQAGLAVYPYTLRVEDLPQGVKFETLLHALFHEAQADGAFTDFPDRVVEFLAD